MWLATLFRQQAPLLRFTLALGERQVWSHDVMAAGFFLRCTDGSLWLTDGEGGDRILHAGDRWGTTRHGRIVVEALSRARFEVEVAPDVQRAPKVFTSLL